jgi:ATP-dependent DNA helicase RecQ
MKRGTSLTAYRDDHGIVEMPLDPAACAQLANEALARGESAAILCRSNRECRQIYGALVTPGAVAASRIDLLGSEDFELRQLRHCGALLDICRSRNDYDFVETYIWEELLREYEQGEFADHQKDRDYLNTLYRLVQEEVGRPRVRDIQAFIQEMRASDVERLKAKKVGLIDYSAKLTIATVHRVKGLEYDTVLVMPSSESFPFRMVNGPLDVDAAEEARLCYVAMTRARNRLYVGWGDREKRWLNCARYKAPNAAYRYCLRGSPEELFVSWPGQERQVQGGLQEYIEKQVCLGDSLSLDGAAVRHGNRVVGRLSEEIARRRQDAGGNPQLRVSNVIRYTCGRYFREHNPQLWDLLDDRVKRQEWFYIVLPEEC